MILEKVYDELMAMIEDLQKKVGSGGGSEVTITPTLESGVKVADYEIDGSEGSIYVPEDVGFSFASSEQKIGTYNGKDLFSRTYSGSWAQTATSKDWFITDIDASAMETILYASLVTSEGIVTTSVENRVSTTDTVQVTTFAARTYTAINVIYTKKTVTRKNRR